MKKKILITGGSSWVALDDIRIITNVFTGATSIRLASALARRGHNVTLLINPGRTADIDQLAGVKVIRYFWFDEFIAIVRGLLRKKRFDCIIHSAALSDFCPEKKHDGKISSKDGFTVRFKPLPKVVALMRALSPAVIVQFKLESKVSKRELIRRAYQSLRENRSDFVVANDFAAIQRGKFPRYLVDAEKNVRYISSQNALASAIDKYVLSR